MRYISLVLPFLVSLRLPKSSPDLLQIKLFWIAKQSKGEKEGSEVTEW